jgi:hypothetical protein
VLAGADGGVVGDLVPDLVRLPAKTITLPLLDAWMP